MENSLSHTSHMTARTVHLKASSFSKQTVASKVGNDLQLSALEVLKKTKTFSMQKFVLKSFLIAVGLCSIIGTGEQNKSV